MNFCPHCANMVYITGLECFECGVKIGGKFKPTAFGMLSQDDQNFIISFFNNNGSIKEMEKDFRVSYPTIKKRIKKIQQALENAEVELRLK